MDTPAPTYDYKQFAILYVDDEEKSLKYFARAFEDEFRILTAPTAQEGLKLLEQHADEIGLLMTDQRMPGEKGVWLLEKARQLRPRIIRILATAFADMDAAIAAVNTGAIYKYVHKPWDPPQLESTLKRGLEFFMVSRERDELLQERMSVLHNVMVADRMVSLGLLASGLSHHIRNSLVAVKTFLDLAPVKLQDENVDLNSLRHPDFWKEYHQHVQGQITRINSLLKDLWTASDHTGGRFGDKVRLHEIVAGVISGLQEEFTAKNIRIDAQISSDLPALTVDKLKFQRAFELLLKDALVSLPAGSVVTITAQARPEAGTVQVRLTDNGPGLPKEALRLIFDPFVLRGDTPTEFGINLMAVYFIVHHHGGRIEAASEEGRGSTFTLTFPLNPNPQPAPEENQQFLEKVLHNTKLWEKLISS